RRYGLLRSAPVEGRPGDRDLALTATVAATPQEAAQVYPGEYWYSMLELPSPEEWEDPAANGISPRMENLDQWVWHQKSACNFCHQLGNEITRETAHMDHLNLGDSEAVWRYRTTLGVRGDGMAAAFLTFGPDRAARMFAD